MSGNFYSLYNQGNLYLHLRQSNDSLMAENIRLRMALDSAVNIDTAQPAAITDTFYNQRYRYVPARVISNSVNQPDNYLTIDKGSAQGITKAQGVMSPTGILGVTRSIAPNFSSVLSVLHSEFRVSAEIAELGKIGTAAWNGQSPEYIELLDIPVHLKVTKGMHVVCSPYSSIFPQGAPIGTVAEVKVNPGAPYYQLKIKLSAGLADVRYAYIITDLYKGGLDSLGALKSATGPR